MNLSRPVTTIAKVFSDNLLDNLVKQIGRELILLTDFTPFCSADIQGIAFSGDGKVVATCSGNYDKEDISIRLRSVESGEQIRVLMGHSYGWIW